MVSFNKTQVPEPRTDCCEANPVIQRPVYTELERTESISVIYGQCLYSCVLSVCISVVRNKKKMFIYEYDTVNLILKSFTKTFIIFLTQSQTFSTA